MALGLALRSLTLARLPRRFDAQQLDFGREVAGADGFVAQEIGAQVLLVAVAEDGGDGGVGAEVLLDLEGAEEVRSGRDADRQSELSGEARGVAIGV